MKNLLIILALLLAAVLQTTAVPFLAFKGVSPNLILVLILFLVIWKGFKQAWWIIVLAVLFYDNFAGLFFGLISLSMVVIAYLIDWLNRTVFSKVRFWIVAGLVAGGTLGYNLLLVLLDRLFQGILTFDLKYVLIEAAYNSLLAAFLFIPAKRIFNRVKNRKYGA